ncbi:MAG: D-alanyl-D-alanine carboxypeptidase family protein [Rhodospirillaceae bacterium]
MNGTSLPKGLLILVLGLALMLPLGLAPVQAEETALVIDADLGAVLHARRPNQRIPPASLTKMMTAYVVFEGLKAGTYRLSDRVEISATARNARPVKIGFAAGADIALGDALKALIGRSANDVAVALAEFVAGDEATFAAYMTRTAHRLGMSRTTFKTANGLPADGQYTTAHDMAVLAQALIRDHPGLYRYLSLKSFRFNGGTMGSINAVLRVYPGADGLKTGFTCASGYNLVASAVRDGRRLIGVVLGNPTGPTRTHKMSALLDQAFAQPLSERMEWLDRITPTATTPNPKPIDNTQRTPACGAGGVSGYAVDIGISRSGGRAAAIAEQGAGVYGGVPYIVKTASGGLVRWKAYVGGLEGATARTICRQRRARGQWCLVRTPSMVAADFRSGARIRR